MEYKQLGGSGLKVSALSFGTATFGWDDTTVAEASRLIDMCLEAGVTLFDTADFYSRGLSKVGDEWVTPERGEQSRPVSRSSL